LPAGPRRAARAGGHRDFDEQLYRQRNVVERCFNGLKQWRDLATRYAKRASIYRSSLSLIAAIIWLT
jgi:transposase